MIKICISVTSYALEPPPPVTNCRTFMDPLPLERDVLYGRPPLSHSMRLDAHRDTHTPLCELLSTGLNPPLFVLRSCQSFQAWRKEEGDANCVCYCAISL